MARRRRTGRRRPSAAASAAIQGGIVSATMVIENVKRDLLKVKKMKKKQITCFLPFPHLPQPLHAAASADGFVRPNNKRNQKAT